MSTHPSTKKRISSLNKWIPEIMLKYPPIKNQILDMEGPVPVIATSEYYNNEYSSRGKIAVLGSSKIFTNKRLKENSGNRILCNNLLYWMLEERELSKWLNKPEEELKIELGKTPSDFLMFGKLSDNIGVYKAVLTF